MGNCIENILGPCQEKQCGRCCDPVKIPFRKGATTFGFNIPVDEGGNPIWVRLPEIRAPERYIDTIRLELYTCLYYDKQNKICRQYEHRPDICRNTSCVDPDCSDSLDQQYKNLTESIFIKIKK